MSQTQVGGSYYETSAKTNQGVDAIFQEIGKRLRVQYGKNPPKPANGKENAHTLACMLAYAHALYSRTRARAHLFSN